MQKKKSRFLAWALCALLLAALPACSTAENTSGGGGAESALSSTDSSAAGAASEAAGAESGGAESGEAGGEASSLAPAEKYASLEDYVNSDELQSSIAGMSDSLGEGMSVEVSADGDMLVYTFTYGDLAGQDLETLGSALSAALEGEDMEETFAQIAASLPEVAEVEEPSVLVRYCAEDGFEIAARQYWPAEDGG